MTPREIQPIPQLHEFISSKLSGSSFNVVKKDEHEIDLEAENLLSIRITQDETRKKITFELYSTKLKRSINVEEIGGIEFMEAELEEELRKENQNGVEEDALLVVDLLNIWTKAYGYDLTHYVNPETVHAPNKPKKKGPKPKS